MAIPKVAPRAILLVGKDLSMMKELVAGGTITPGHLLAINASGKYVVHPTAAGRAMRIFADMADLIGKGIDDNYSVNDNVYAWVVPQGAEINALVAASATAIVVGDYLESAGDGTLRKATAASGLAVPNGGGTVVLPGNAVAQALEAVDNSAGGTAARIKVIAV